MAVAKPIRILGLTAVLLIVLLIYSTKGSTYSAGSKARTLYDPARKFRVDKSFSEPNLELSSEPEEPLVRVMGDNYAPDYDLSPRANATLLSLVRNSELEDMLSTMRDLERTFNNKFNYPWLFLNDEPFTEEFKRKISAETKAQVTFDIVPKEHWEMPDWINEDLYAESVVVLQEKGVGSVDKKSYHQMCRWNSGMFYKHPRLQNTKWFWRVEPNTRFFCDIDYDVFRWMEDHDKTYGFTISLYDNPDSVSSLWPETMKFMTDNNKYLHANNAMKWLQDADHRPDHYKRANGYSTCHFWSNFEIADMNFFRSEAYEAYFNHLDKAGGFFYERWGDAPVHSIALGLFEDKSKIHWFQDIGYQHAPFYNCPNSAKCTGCDAGKFTDSEPWLHQEDCRPVWFKIAGRG